MNALNRNPWTDAWAAIGIGILERQDGSKLLHVRLTLLLDEDYSGRKGVRCAKTD
jgi:hypothetical protein